MIKEIVRKPTMEDVEYLIDHVRPEDIEEVDAFTGSTIRAALEQTPDLLENSQVWEVDGKVVAMFGVTPIEEHGIGLIWMLATSEFEQYSMMCAVRCKNVFKKVIQGYDMVYNYVYSKNKKSIGWLKWLGFQICEAEPVGHKGELFNRFEMKQCAIQ